MGSTMARSLVTAGQRSRPLVEPGAHQASDIAAVCRGAVVITMLADDTAVADIAFADDGLIASPTIAAPFSMRIRKLKTISPHFANCNRTAPARRPRSWPRSVRSSRPNTAIRAAW